MLSCHSKNQCISARVRLEIDPKFSSKNRSKMVSERCSGDARGLLGAGPGRFSGATATWFKDSRILGGSQDAPGGPRGTKGTPQIDRKSFCFSKRSFQTWSLYQFLRIMHFSEHFAKKTYCSLTNFGQQNVEKSTRVFKAALVFLEHGDPHETQCFTMRKLFFQCLL